MKLTIPALTVENNDAFKNDIFGRKDFGEALANLIVNTEDELVISLDGKWGEGKTTFIKMWQGLLSEKKIPNLYIDSFANDYVDDAFIVLASAISSYVEKNITKTGEQKITEFKEKAKKIGSELLLWSAKVGIKAATLGIIKESDIDSLSEIKNDLAKGSSELIGNIIEEKLNSHAKDTALLQSFKDILSKIPNNLENNDNNPLVVIIDELDRCKPSFAIEILEKVKHLFSVKNVIFVLVINQEQLEEAVRCIYGQRLEDAHTYLQKFINVETSLPKKTLDQHDNNNNKYINRLLRDYGFDEIKEQYTIRDYLEPLSEHFALSFRELEKTFTNLAVFYTSTSGKELRFVPIVVFLSIIKVVNKKIFENLFHQKITYNELCKEIKLKNHPTEEVSLSYLDEIIIWLKVFLLNEQEFNEIEKNDIVSKFWQSFRYHVKREKVIPLVCQQINMFSVN